MKILITLITSLIGLSSFAAQISHDVPGASASAPRYRTVTYCQDGLEVSCLIGPYVHECSYTGANCESSPKTGHFSFAELLFSGQFSPRGHVYPERDYHFIFDDVPVGSESEPYFLNLRNASGNSVDLSISIRDPGSSGDFFVDASNCLTISPKGGCAISVSFKPTRTGFQYGYVEVRASDGSSFDILLNGDGK